MRLNQILLAGLMLLLASPALAAFRLSGGLGIGSSTTSDEISQSEGPLTQLYNFEYLVHSRLIMGVEHLRSLNMSPMSTAISFTGVFARSYFNAAPTPYASANDMGIDELIVRDTGYFWGIGAGFSNSNLLPDKDNKSSNAAGIYLSPRIGFEKGMTRHTGFRGELMIAVQMFGAGSISSFSLIGSFYYSF